METTKCNLFIKSGLFGSKRESFTPTDMSWPKNVWLEIGPVSLKLYATQFTVFSEYPKLAWSRDVFFDVISNPETTALSFLSVASNVVFATSDHWDAEIYAFSNNIPYYDFYYSPLSFNFKLKRKGDDFVSIAYRKI